MTNFLIMVEHHASVKQPDLTSKEDCLLMYSPKDILLKPREDMYLDLKRNVEFDERSMEKFDLWFNVLCKYKQLGLFVEGNDWVNNITKNNTIQLHLLNKSHYYDVKIKKDSLFARLFILGKTPNNRFETQYKRLYY